MFIWTTVPLIPLLFQKSRVLPPRKTSQGCLRKQCHGDPQCSLSSTEQEFITDGSWSCVHKIGSGWGWKHCTALSSVTREPWSWTKLCEMCSAETQHCIEWVLQLWSKRIPLSGRYLAPVLRKFGCNNEKHKLMGFFFLFLLGKFWSWGNRNPLRQKPNKKVVIILIDFFTLSSWCLARTHIEKFTGSLNEGTQLSFFLYNENRYISVWHQGEILSNDVFCTNERLFSRGR